MQPFKRTLLVFLCLTVCASAVHADDLTNKNKRFSVAGQRVDTEIFSGHKAILLFWRDDCAPCLKEMSMLPELLKANPDVHIGLVSLKDAVQWHSSLPPEQENLIYLATAIDPKTLLAGFGQQKPYIPYSVALHADGTLCDSHTGMLGLTLATQWAKTC